LYYYLKLLPVKILCISKSSSFLTVFLGGVKFLISFSLNILIFQSGFLILSTFAISCSILFNPEILLLLCFGCGYILSLYSLTFSLFLKEELAVLLTLFPYSSGEKYLSSLINLLKYLYSYVTIIRYFVYILHDLTTV